MNGNIYVRVDHDGHLTRDPRCTVEEQHSANFIVIQKDGELVVWKDRYGRAGVVVTKAQADARALDHLDIAQGRKGSREIYRY